MLGAEVSLPDHNSQWWLEELNKADLVIKYWRRHITLTKQRCEDSEVLTKFEEEIGIDVDIYQGN
eukprot:1342502-Ditylum_brightwellii.AAC.1